MKTMKKLLPWIVIVIAAAGCSPVNSNGTKPADSSSNGNLKVVYIAKSSGNPYFTQIENGFKKAASQMGFEYSSQSPATADATSQLEIIKGQIQRGVDVIAISPNSPDALDQVLDEARRKGIVVICVDDDLVGNETHRDAAVLPCDVTVVGDSQIDLMGKLMNYTGDFAILSATTDAPNQNAWIAEMKKQLALPKFANMHLVTTVYGDDESQKSATETEALIAKYPHLGGILSPTSVGLAAAAQVLDDEGVYPGGDHASKSGIQLTGLSTPNQMKKPLEKGVVSSFQLWDPADSGYLAGCLGVLIKEKKVTITTGASVAVPGGNPTKVEDKGVLFTGPMLTFDKSNISKYNF